MLYYSPLYKNLFIVIVIAVIAFVIIAIVLIVIKKKRNGQYNVDQDLPVERSMYTTSNPLYNNESLSKFMEEKGDLYDYIDVPQTEKKEKL